MAHDDTSPHLGQFEFGIIKRNVRQMIGRAGFKAQDREDLEQTLLLRLIRSLKSFDPERGHLNAFATVVVESATSKILRDAIAQKRDQRRMVYEANRRSDESGGQPIELIDSCEKDARHCRDPLSAETLAELKLDLAEVIDRLPDPLRDLTGRLKTQSITEIARELRKPRTTIAGWVKRIRKHFEEAGLRDYWK